MEGSFGREQRMADVLDLAHLAEVGTFMGAVFGNRPDDGPAPPMRAEPPERVEHPQQDIDGVDELLARASKAIEVLATRCEILAHDLAEAGARADEHEQTSERWKSIAVELRTQAMFHRKEIGELKARSDAAEARILLLEASATDAQERVAAADAWSERLQGQVVAAFGHKSRIHSVLQSITLAEAAE